MWKSKEADSIVLSCVPNVKQLWSWTLDVRKSVAACSMDPKRAVQWISEFESSTTMWGAIAALILCFRTVDTQLSQALFRTLTGIFELQREATVLGIWPNNKDVSYQEGR